MSFAVAQQPLVSQGLPIIQPSQSNLVTHTPSVGPLWTRDRPVPETSTWQHTTFTRDRHICPPGDSNTQSQQASRKPTPDTAGYWWSACDLRKLGNTATGHVTAAVASVPDRGKTFSTGYRPNSSSHNLRTGVRGWSVLEDKAPCEWNSTLIQICSGHCGKDKKFVFLAGNLTVAIFIVPAACIHKVSAVLYREKGSFVFRYASALLFHCEK